MSATPSAEKLLPHCDNWVGQSGSRFVWRSTRRKFKNADPAWKAFQNDLDFTVSQGESVVERYKKRRADCSFNEKNVRYNDKSFFDLIESYYRKWITEGRPEVVAVFPNAMITVEFRFAIFLRCSLSSLTIYNEIDKFYLDFRKAE